MFVHYTDCWPTNHLYLYIWLVSTVSMYNILHIGNIWTKYHPNFFLDYWGCCRFCPDDTDNAEVRSLMPVVVLMMSPAPVANRTAPPRAGNICHRGFPDITLLVTVTAGWVGSSDKLLSCHNRNNSAFPVYSCSSKWLSPVSISPPGVITIDHVLTILAAVVVSQEMETGAVIQSSWGEIVTVWC